MITDPEQVDVHGEPTGAEVFQQLMRVANALERIADALEASQNGDASFTVDVSGVVDVSAREARDHD